MAEDAMADGTRQRVKNQKLKPRSLLLHATVVNTIYVRGGGYRGQSNHRGGRKNGPLTFDARDIISHYRDYYLDGTRTEKKQFPFDNTAMADPEDQISNDGSAASSEEAAHPSRGIKQTQPDQKQDQRGKYPFIWAANLLLEKVCICEMGARKLDGESNPLAARLGQEYRVVAERSLLDFSRDEDGDGDGSVSVV
jgi:activating signal cointegrator complex subunit 1